MWGELSYEFGASCLRASCLWGELSVIRSMIAHWKTYLPLVLKVIGSIQVLVGSKACAETTTNL